MLRHTVTVYDTLHRSRLHNTAASAGNDIAFSPCAQQGCQSLSCCSCSRQVCDVVYARSEVLLVQGLSLLHSGNCRSTVTAGMAGEWQH